MNILVTGGAGYIGSHTTLELLQTGHNVVVIDNLSNSSKESIIRVEKITGKPVIFYDNDVCDKVALETIFSNHSFDAVIHFAALKAVGESVNEPLKYYRNNIDSTLSLLEIMTAKNVMNFIFSSSATVYGSAPIPYQESSPAGQGITSPYGQTKYMIEQILTDWVSAAASANATLLRYFNPVGAHESGEIGEDPTGIPNNLMPFIAQVAAGKRTELSIFGNDYPTVDGTCVRDYIHVVDLAKGHLAALEKSPEGLSVYNLGSGVGTSVLQLVKSFIQSTGIDIPFIYQSRRLGDLPEFYASPEKANTELDWKVKRTIEDMCRDTWNWQEKNPLGYT